MTHALDFSERADWRDTLSAESTDQPEAGWRPVYRLRDLDGRRRWAAFAFTVALLIAPAVAFAWAMPDWAPAGDTALMGLRALDVGTARTPLTGQPSSSQLYVSGDQAVHHPGPTHFYLLAGPIRLFGDMGMPLLSVLIIGSCVLIAAWAVFRQLGPAAGVIAAVLLSGIMFTTGMASLIDPVSSRIAGYPLLCGSVLLWCVLCGDLRLLPLTVAVVSFAAQQHLSVGPALAVLTAGSLVGLAVSLVLHRRWRDRHVRRDLLRWGVWSAIVAAVMWAPVVLDQLFDDGNLGRIVDYAGNNDAKHLGFTSAVHQVVHALGLPPLLGQTEFSGRWLLAEPSTLTWISAVVVLGLVAALGVRWRRTSPIKTSLVIMTGIAVVAGLANGASVPVGIEQLRPAFYHWAFVVAFFAYLVLGLGVLDLVRSTKLATQPWAAPAFTSLALLAIILPGALNPTLDRTTNTLAGTHAFWKGQGFDRLADTILAHRRELGAQTVLMGAGSRAMAFELARRGFDVRHPRDSRGFVDDDRLVDRATVDTGLVLQAVTRRGHGKVPPGKLLADVELDPGERSLATVSIFQPTEVVRLRLYMLDRNELFDFARPGQL